MTKSEKILRFLADNGVTVDEALWILRVAKHKTKEKAVVKHYETRREDNYEREA